MSKLLFLPGGEESFPAYARAVRAAGAEISGDPERCQALILPGGGDVEPWRYGQENTACTDLEPERDAEEWRLLSRFSGQGKPVLGICRGMQLINIFFGGTLHQDIPGHTKVEGRDRLHEVRTAPGAFRGVFRERETVNSAHHQAVDRLGSGLAAAQWAEDGIVEGLYHETLPVWAVQWHPERLEGDAGMALLRGFLALK